MPILHHHHQRQQAHKPQPRPKRPSHSRLRGCKSCEKSGAWTEKDRGRESRLR
ncbi:hypothetical protein BJ165DRAFT_1426810 [Panaeolus papilionaceus]|nr:hypothetical protein BJ165DRAFT_1426810 [Panaeolus papilionaceus]